MPRKAAWVKGEYRRGSGKNILDKGGEKWYNRKTVTRRGVPCKLNNVSEKEHQKRDSGPLKDGRGNNLS